MSEPAHDLNELFNRDPLLLSKPEIESIIQGFRDMRYKFNTGDLKAGKVKTPKAAAAATLMNELNIDL
jgi:hypothetical protein